MSCRALLGGIALLGVLHVPSYGQDLLPREIRVVDQGCIERKVIQCMAIGTAGINLICGDGFSKKGGQCWFTSPSIFLRDRVHSPISNPALNDLTFDEGARFHNRRNNLFQMIPQIDQCRTIVEAFPSAYGTENCLKPLAEERILNALTIELRDLVKQLCHLSGDPECVDDEVPVEAASPDAPPTSATQAPS